MTNHQQIKSGDFIEFNTKEHLQKEDIYKSNVQKMHSSVVADFATAELKSINTCM